MNPEFTVEGVRERVVDMLISRSCLLPPKLLIGVLECLNIEMLDRICLDIVFHIGCGLLVGARHAYASSQLRDFGLPGLVQTVWSRRFAGEFIPGGKP